jgi:hypothetical protein
MSDDASGGARTAAVVLYAAIVIEVVAGMFLSAQITLAVLAINGISILLAVTAAEVIEDIEEGDSDE